MALQRIGPPMPNDPTTKIEPIMDPGAWLQAAPVGTTVPMDAFLRLIGAEGDKETAGRTTLRLAGTLWRNSFDAGYRLFWVKVEGE